MMKRFLQETWELWCWAMFRPSKLQQRMNSWCPTGEIDGYRVDTQALDILLFRPNPRFIIQYLLLILFFNLPFSIATLISGQSYDWFLSLLSLLSAYCLGLSFLPIGLHTPILWSIFYSKPDNFYAVINPIGDALFSMLSSSILNLLDVIILKLVDSTLETLSAWLISWLLTILFFLSVFFLTPLWILFSDYISYTRVFLIIILSIPIVTGYAAFIFFLANLCVALGGSQMSVTLITFIGALVGFSTANRAAKINALYGVIGLLIGAFTSMTITVASVLSSLDKYPFLFASGLLAVCLAPVQCWWLGFIAALALPILGIEHLGLNAALTVPVVLIGYYRLLPDYLLLSSISSIFSIGSAKLFNTPKSVELLHWLPPHTTELLWLPLVEHDRLLVAAFRTDASKALATFQQMQALKLFGFKRTVELALPQIIADQYLAITNTQELTAIGNQEHPLLSHLAPYIVTEELLPYVRLPKKAAETFIVRFYLRRVAEDVEAGLAVGSAALRERSLNRIFNTLMNLNTQIPGLVSSRREIRCWQSVVQRWCRIVELEMAQQKAQAREELLNPFQFGNPLRPAQASNIFKGRQAFADQIVRLVLDRNRPTLVLHGPRRCGKSSFLLNLPRLLPSDLLPVYLDLQKSGMTSSEGDFCYGLARAIHHDSRSQGLKLPATPERDAFYRNPYPILEDWLDEALPEVGDRRILLNLDEFEKIGSAVDEKRISLRLFDELRSLIQHTEQLGFLFSGVQTLDELGPNWSSYFISVVPIEMLYLQPDEAEDLLQNPDPDFALRYDEGIVATLLHLTRCHPYLLQLLGFALVKQANFHNTQSATFELLQTAIQDAFTSGEPFFTNVWTEFTGTNSDEVKAGQSILLALVQGEQPSFKLSESAEIALRRMLRCHLLERTEIGYQFEVPLVEQWVRERAISY